MLLYIMNVKVARWVSGVALLFQPCGICWPQPDASWPWLYAVCLTIVSVQLQELDAIDCRVITTVGSLVETRTLSMLISEIVVEVEYINSLTDAKESLQDATGPLLNVAESLLDAEGSLLSTAEPLLDTTRILLGLYASYLDETERLLDPTGRRST